jgi:hypothetical protein
MDLAEAKVKRIVFTGDFFRPSPYRERPTQHFNIGWLANLLGQQLSLAAGLPMERLFWGGDGRTDGQLDVGAMRALYAAFGMDAISLANWAKIAAIETIPDSVARYFHFLFRDALVIGFELPDLLKIYLDQAGIAYVDCVIHPIRFMDDIFLAMSSNHGGLRGWLQGQAISHEQVFVSAGLASAAAARDFRFETRGRTALLIGQVTSDRTQIRDGRFAGFTDFAPELETAFHAYDDILVKAHPLDPNNVGIRFVEGSSTRVRRVGENVYSLLALPGIADVITLSSSVGMEAPYFGCRTQFLLREPVRLAQHGEMLTDGRYVGIYDAFLSPDFWRGALDTLDDVDVTPLTGFTVAPKPNRLRISLQSFWGFDAIDNGQRAA